MSSDYLKAKHGEIAEFIVIVIDFSFEDFT